MKKKYLGTGLTFSLYKKKGKTMITAFVNGTVFIGDGRILEKGTVIVDGRRIIKVSKSHSPIPIGAHRIDLSGHMMFPGFIDCHTHLCLDGSPDPVAGIQGLSVPMLTLRAAESARKTLMAGVTTVRDMGGVGHVEITIRDAVRQGLIAGPRILACGRLVCITGGHGWRIGGREADGPDEVKKAVREQIKAGCDGVKLMATGGVLTPGSEPGCPQMTEEELRAGIEEAHKAGRLTAAHAQGEKGIENAVNAGIDSIEHGIFLNERIIARMQEKKTALVPTFSAPLNILRGKGRPGIPDEVVTKTAQVKNTHFASMVMARKAGIPMAMGTDAGTPLNQHGDNLNEIIYMTQAGFTPEQAFRAATGIGAKILGIQKDLGTIEVGKLADLVVVQGDPLAEVDRLKDPVNILWIFQAGQQIKEGCQ
jgi:imidazolonepropionase-like amidohydrolase